MYYVRNGKLMSYEEILNFEKQLKEECKKIASNFIKKIDVDNNLKVILKGKIDSLERYDKKFTNQFHNTIEKLTEDIKIE